MRCALTAPFHPYPHHKRSVGGLFSVALVVRLLCPAVSWHSALCSSDFPLFDCKFNNGLIKSLKINLLKQRPFDLPRFIISDFYV